MFRFSLQREITKAGTQTQKHLPRALQFQSGTEDYYSFDYGNMHVLVLNTQISYSVGSSQYNFAMADLSSTSKPGKSSFRISPHTAPADMVKIPA